MSSPVDLLLAKLEGVKRSGDGGHQWVACCPAHEDAHQSLTVGVTREGVVLVHCYAGCAWKDVVASVGLGPGDLYPEEEGEAPPRVTPTVRLLAWDKRLPEEFLREQCKLADVPDGVEIPYANAAGEVIARKKRTDLVARLGSSWPAGQPLETYGQRALSRWRGAGVLVLVEGESDCWTLWYHGFPALGVPGSGGSRAVTAEQVEGFATIYVWQEPDAGGAKMVEGVAKRLAEVGWSGELRVVKGGPAKDPNALHQRDPEGFKDAFRGLLDAAEAANVQQAKPGEKKQKKERAVKREPLIPGIVTDQQKEAETKAGGPPPAPGYFGLTDWGNAQRLVFRHGKDLRFVWDWGCWLVWNGRSWAEKQEAAVEQHAKDAVRAIYAESHAAEAADMRQRLADHAVRSESARSIKAMIDLARSERGVPVTPDKLDGDPWLLNCVNGTIDLRTGTLLKHRREFLLTKMCPTPYEESARGEHWPRFLETIFDGNRELIDFVQRLFGYCITGSVAEQALPVLWGCGANGKSTLLNAVMSVLGPDYSMQAPAGLLVTKKTEHHPTELADLFGKRMVSSTETGQGNRLDEALVKQLTGGDRIRARRMRENMWEFRPTHKLLLCTNHKPQIRGTDHAIWRRLRLVPFTVTIPEEKQDKDLAAKLEGEASVILAWCVAGCLAWQRQGLCPPAEVRQATADYRVEEDALGEFLEDCCVTKGKNLKVKAADLYARYERWCMDNGERANTQRSFGMALGERGFKRERGTGGTHWWHGLELAKARAESDPSDPSDPKSYSTPHASAPQVNAKNGSLRSLGSLKEEGRLDLSEFDA